MSATVVITYEVDLSELSPDASKAGKEFGSLHLSKLPERNLRTLLLAAEKLAPQVAYPLAPEIRVVSPAGRFVVLLKEGQLRFVSWAATKSTGTVSTVEQMLAVIRGETFDDSREEARSSARAAREPITGTKRILAVAFLLLFILLLNIVTVSKAKKPPGNFLPPLRLLDPAPAERVLVDVAGNYETGSAPGDRRLQIAAKGNVTWIKFGPGRSVAERKEFTVQPAEAKGAKALLTSRKSLIKIKDPTSVVLFGDSYVRVLN